MKNKTLNKNILRSISSSLGRFLSIFSLMLLGVFVFIGLKVAGPDMRATAEHFFEQQNLADFTVISSYGLDKSDQEIILNRQGLDEVEFGYFQDLIIKDSTIPVRIFSKTESLSQYELISGELPQKENEIALDFLYQKDYKIGEEILFEEDDESILKEKKFKITAFVKSSELLDKNDYGLTQVGTGQLEAYAVVIPSTFDSELYQISRISFKSTEGLSPYNKKFTQISKNFQENLKKDFKSQAEKRLGIIKSDALSEISSLKEQLNNESLNLQTQQELLNQQKEMLTAAGMAESLEIIEAQEQLDEAKQTIQENLALSQEEEDKINTLPLPTYSISNRKEGNPGYQMFLDNSTRIDVLSNVFPVVLFAIAIFVCLTTMTRFVEEERSNLGLLKALGYSDRQIYKKFIIYGLVSGGLGTLLGIVLGHTFLPKIVFEAYTSASTISDLILTFSLKYSLLALLISVACTAIPAYLVVKKELKSVPAHLFLAKPPKIGSRIFLEKVPFIWNKMSFTYKVTARNLFRYKQRMLMTIIGVAGCTALLIMGFGIRDSISGLSQRQFGNLLHYDMIAISKENPTDAEQEEINQLLKSEGIINSTKSHYEELSIEINKEDVAVSLFVVNESKSTKDYVNLRNRVTSETYNMNEEEIILTEKLADLLNINVGDEVSFKNTDNKEIKLKVSAISEMYIGHYIFINSEAYQSAFGEEVNMNANLIKTKDKSEEFVSQLAQNFMDSDPILAISMNFTSKNTVNSFLNGINSVMLVLLICAILLAVVVIYNLTNINVSERIRELSTIKVLGFYDKEVTLYIYRETIFLSLIGIIAGFGLGAYFHNLIITMLATSDIMFQPGLLWTNLVSSTLITLFTSLALSIVIHFQLKRVDMLGALKSID
ncbi:MAG: FtsX-like permease family protein [Lactovum sp.]